jgi:hypothetical protein
MPASSASTQLESDLPRLGNPARFNKLGKCSRSRLDVVRIARGEEYLDTLALPFRHAGELNAVDPKRHTHIAEQETDARVVPQHLQGFVSIPGGKNLVAQLISIAERPATAGRPIPSNLRIASRLLKMWP